MKIDLTCPVELWQYAMPTEDDADCTFVMNNLSDKVVVSVQVTLKCFDKEDMLLFSQTERIQGLKAGVGERFSIMLLPSQWRDVEGVDLVIEKVWFDDSTIWRRGNAPLTYYKSNALPGGRALDQLRFVAGKDAVGYPCVQDQVWLCVCGRANALESDRCCRCERRRDAVFASYSPDNVAHVIAAHEQKLAMAARKAREENNLVIEKQEVQRASKRRRRRMTVWAAGLSAAVVALAAVIILWVVPAVRYQSAMGLIDSGQFDEARAAFSAMGDYRDAQAQLAACDYQEALSLMETGGVDALVQAEADFAALGDYQDSADRLKQATYALGQAYLEAGSYELAADRFLSLGDYQDSPEMFKEASYQQAQALYDGGNYTVARVLFQNLADYSDSADRAQACTYQEGKALYDAGDYAGAVAALAPLGEYEDAAQLVKQANYAMAEAKLTEGQDEEAGRLFLAAGDYSDAVARGNDCIYQAALAAKETGDYDKATELFTLIIGYLDSEGQIQDCLYQQAVALRDSGDYAGALALLEMGGTPRNEDAQQLYYECNYELAMAAIEKEDLERAQTLLENVDNYEDSEKQLNAVRYELAEAALAAENYADARILYNALGSYKDSATKLKQCSYAIASAALAAGDYAAAISGFEALGSYQDSAAMFEEAAYQQALALKTAGDTQGAMEVLAELTDSDRAQAELIAIQLEQGAELEAAGDYAGAAEVYAAIEDSEEAQERYNACMYNQAEQLRDAGDLTAAGAAFEALGDYRDAADQSVACYQTYFGNVAQTARDAMEDQDYPAVIAALEGFAMDDLAGSYADLPEIYNEACYQYAERLYQESKPYEALPYYQRVGDYRDTPESKLERRAYLILGEWTSTTGKTAVFRADGTCDLMGETLHFYVSNFSLYTGVTEDDMTITHKLSSIDKTSMSLRDIRDGQDVVYKFSRVGEWTLPEVTVETTSAPEEESVVETTPAPETETAAEATPAPEEENGADVATPLPTEAVNDAAE